MTPPLNEEQDKLLKKIYFDDKMYFGRDRLFQYLYTNHKDMKISRRQVMDWLKKRELAQLYRDKRETTDIKKTILSEPYKQIGIDLKDMSTRAYQGWKWILTGIDLFSKRAWALPMKNKEAPTVLKTFIKMLGQMDKKPGSIRSDNGSEFIDSKFKSYLKEQGIKQVFSKDNSPQSNGQIERFNGILGRLIEMYIHQNDDQNWTKILPTLVDNYNKTISRTTGETPYKVEKETKKQQEKTKERIKKTVLPKNDKADIKFKVMDKVRIKLEQADTFSKSRQNWSEELYLVRKVFKPKADSVLAPSYEIMTLTREPIEERYYNEDLQKVGEVLDKVKAPKKYRVSKIVRPVMKRNGRKYTPSYEVRWIGYKDTTIEPKEQLERDIPKKVEKYNKEHNVKWTKTKVTFKQ